MLEAAYNGHAAVLKLLLDNGGSCDATNNAGASVLQLACIAGRTDCVKILLEGFLFVGCGVTPAEAQTPTEARPTAAARCLRRRTKALRTSASCCFNSARRPTFKTQKG